jgi:hypothetical protein
MLRHRLRLWKLRTGRTFWFTLRGLLTSTFASRALLSPNYESQAQRPTRTSPQSWLMLPPTGGQ